jgi:N-acetylneuraminic acid mutarotase
MHTYTPAALCGLGLIVLACGEPVTQPSAVSESTQSSQTAVTGTWRLTRRLVPARAGIAAAVSDKSIVVVGGWIFGGMLKRVDAYNVETRTWTELRSLPQPRFGHGATTINGKIYVAGGSTRLENGNSVPHNSLFVYNPGANTWTRKADMPQPVYRSLQAAVLGRLYVYAGEEGTFFAYSPRTDKWVTLRPPPSRHNLGVMAAVDGKLYLTGGLRQGTANVSNTELDVYDPATKSWTIKQPIRLNDSYMVATTLHRKLWVASSPGDVVDGYVIYRSVQVYDPVSDQWNDGPPMLSDSRDGAAVVAGGRLYVIGGTNRGYVTSVVQALSTSY